MPAAVPCGDGASLDVAVDREHRQAIPPEVDHEVHAVEPLGAVRFSVEFLRR